MPTLLNNRKISRRKAFTLLELIGVLSVVSILLTAAIPLTFNIIQNQRLVGEKNAIPQLVDAIKRGMLREQRFPLYENSTLKINEDLNDSFWWKLAARHGAVSNNEARYPVGSRNTQSNTRKLYFADASISGLEFSSLTGDGSGWLSSISDPSELRLLLISTTNPDLPLPNIINPINFNNFWDDWAIGTDGNPLLLDWVDYGLSQTDWDGRAADLFVERIDLRDWVCEVTIEVRRALDLTNFSSWPFDSTSTTDSVHSVKIENVSGVRVYLARATTVDALTGDNAYSIESVTIDGHPQTMISDSQGTGEFTELTPKLHLIDDTGSIIETIDLDLEERNQTLNFDNTSSALQTRYFLLNEIISLYDSSDTQVGAFVLDESYKTIRYDGYRWQY